MSAMFRTLAMITMFLVLQESALCARPAQQHVSSHATRRPPSLIGVQYEPWFVSDESWANPEAIPVAGKYTIEPNIVAKHFAQFKDLGVDWLLLDWSNMLWSQPQWEQHSGSTAMLENATRVVFDTAVKQRQRGKYAPKLVFMIGLQNGPAVKAGADRLNGILDWLGQQYLNRKEYRDLWLYEKGKPLITVLYWPRNPCDRLARDLASKSLRSKRWTVRWMASQLQDNHAERCGMWSWMDGTIPQILTKRNGKAEEIVVTPAAFRLPGPGTGWTGRSAIGRDNGVTYLKSWSAAFAHRPRFIQVHQWNEFAGQKDGESLPIDYWKDGEYNGPNSAPPVYADEYNLEFSDDIEPTLIDKNICTQRSCGGWGYYYYNLTRALISLYRGITPNMTVLALGKPSISANSDQKSIALHWAYIGHEPSSLTVFLDGRKVSDNIRLTETSLDISHEKPGFHEISITANGTSTYFDLNDKMPAKRLASPIPVTSKVSFIIPG